MIYYMDLSQTNFVVEMTTDNLISNRFRFIHNKWVCISNIQAVWRIQLQRRIKRHNARTHTHCCNLSAESSWGQCCSNDTAVSLTLHSDMTQQSRWWPFIFNRWWMGVWKSVVFLFIPICEILSAFYCCTHSFLHHPKEHSTHVFVLFQYICKMYCNM